MSILYKINIININLKIFFVVIFFFYGFPPIDVVQGLYEWTYAYKFFFKYINCPSLPQVFPEP